MLFCLRAAYNIIHMQSASGSFIDEYRCSKVTSGSTDLSEGAFPDETLSYRSIHTSDLSRSDSVVVVLIVPLVLSPREGGREGGRWELGNHHITSVVYIYAALLFAFINS